MQTKREDFINEILEERKLREVVRTGIKTILERKKKVVDESTQFKVIIQHLIKEAKAKNIAVHDSTGMNRLEDLFSNTSFLDTLEKAYMSLTSAPEQRKSFRAHLLNAVEALLQTDDLNRSADAEETGSSSLMSRPAKPLAEGDINVDVEDDVEDVNKSDEEKEEEDFSIPGMDETGRNIALQAFNGLKDLIKNALKPIVNSEDKELFMTYLVKNLNLYLDTYEESITGEFDNQQPMMP